MFKLMGNKILQFYAHKISLPGSMVMAEDRPKEGPKDGQMAEGQKNRQYQNDIHLTSAGDYKMTCATGKDSDQPRYQPCLISLLCPMEQHYTFIEQRVKNLI